MCRHWPAVCRPQQIRWIGSQAPSSIVLDFPLTARLLSLPPALAAAVKLTARRGQAWLVYPNLLVVLMAREANWATRKSLRVMYLRSQRRRAVVSAVSCIFGGRKIRTSWTGRLFKKIRRYEQFPPIHRFQLFNSVHIDPHYERFIPHGLCRFIPCGTTPAFLLLFHFGWDYWRISFLGMPLSVRVWCSVSISCPSLMSDCYYGQAMPLHLFLFIHF